MTHTWDDDLAAEAVRHLTALLRCDTTNPPGNEATAIAYIREQLVADGIEPEIVEPAPGRANLYARLRGTGAQRPLLLLSHVDVVPVERDKWTADPFGGELRDGFIYGRGAVDMKDMAAMELTLFLHFARSQRETGATLSRDLVLLAVADEEQFGTFGMAWIVEHKLEWLDAEYALNEGGGTTVEMGGQRVYLCEAAQKGSALLTLHAHGKPGHASIPHRDNAIARLSRAIATLTNYPQPLHVIPTTRRLIELLADLQKQPQKNIFLQTLNPLLSDRVLGIMPNQDVANGLRAMLHNTISPTLISAGTALNVIPSEATAYCDVRLLPGQTGESLAGDVRRRVRDKQVEVIVEAKSLGYEMRSDTPLFAAISAAVATHDPHAIVAPYLFPAVSDSRFLAPLGIIPYGFIPHQPEPGVPPVQSLAHGHDERVSVANIAFGLHVLYDTLSTMGE